MRLCLGPFCIIWDNLFISKSLTICNNYLHFFKKNMNYNSPFWEIYFGEHFFSAYWVSLFFLISVWCMVLSPSLVLTLSSQPCSHWECVCVCVCKCVRVHVWANLFYFFTHIMKLNWIAATSFSSHMCFKTYGECYWIPNTDIHIVNIEDLILLAFVKSLLIHFINHTGDLDSQSWRE